MRTAVLWALGLLFCQVQTQLCGPISLYTGLDNNCSPSLGGFDNCGSCENWGNNCGPSCGSSCGNSACGCGPSCSSNCGNSGCGCGPSCGNSGCGNNCGTSYNSGCGCAVNNCGGGYECGCTNPCDSCCGSTACCGCGASGGSGCGCTNAGTNCGCGGCDSCTICNECGNGCGCGCPNPALLPQRNPCQIGTPPSWGFGVQTAANLNLPPCSIPGPCSPCVQPCSCIQTPCNLPTCCIQSCNQPSCVQPCNCQACIPPCNVQVPSCNVQIPPCNVQVPCCPNSCGAQALNNLGSLIQSCSNSCGCGCNSNLLPISSCFDSCSPQVVPVIDNTLAVSLANALQLLIVSQLLDNSNSNTLSSCDSGFPCGNVIELLAPDYCQPDIFEVPCYQEPDCGNPCGNQIAIPYGSILECLNFGGFDNMNLMNPVNCFGGCDMMSPVAAEVVLPAEIPAQLLCNIGYSSNNCPYLSMNVEPLMGNQWL